MPAPRGTTAGNAQQWRATMSDLYHHAFADTTEVINTGFGRGFHTPLWIVGFSPFDDVETDGEGHVVHLGAPRFVARWFIGDEPANPADTISGITFNHPGLDITLCELVFLDEPPPEFADWLTEAAAAIAHYRGDIAAAEPEDH